MKSEKIVRLIGFIFSITGFYLIAINTNVVTAIGVYVLVFGNWIDDKGREMADG